MTAASAERNIFNFSEEVSPTKKLFASLGLSIMTHFLVVITIKSLNLKSIPIVKPSQESYVDLGYQEYDEPPQIVETKTSEVKDIPEAMPEKAEDLSPSSHELNDQSSDIASLQKEQVNVPQPMASPKNVNTTDIPYYKVKPKYPKEALLSGIEGFILLEIDIKEDGTVENLKLTGGEKINLFENEARRAVVKWKYKPFLDGLGNPIRKTQHLVRVDFKLIDDQAQN
jgi:protein TonB